MNFTFQPDPKLKMKEWEKIGKYSNLVWELKKLGNMKMKMILFVVDTLETILKGWKKTGGIRGEKESISSVQVKSVRIFRGV